MIRDERENFKTSVNIPFIQKENVERENALQRPYPTLENFGTLVFSFSPPTSLLQFAAVAISRRRHLHYPF
uniref:Uncharacterized protein n=1 Tax=Cucumis melo TaxID=3656 RepID=A0A9I9E8C8_CUCME